MYQLKKKLNYLIHEKFSSNKTHLKLNFNINKSISYDPCFKTSNKVKPTKKKKRTYCCVLITTTWLTTDLKQKKIKPHIVYSHYY